MGPLLSFCLSPSLSYSHSSTSSLYLSPYLSYSHSSSSLSHSPRLSYSHSSTSLYLSHSSTFYLYLSHCPSLYYSHSSTALSLSHSPFLCRCPFPSSMPSLHSIASFPSLSIFFSLSFPSSPLPLPSPPTFYHRLMNKNMAESSASRMRSVLLLRITLKRKEEKKKRTHAR